MLKYKTKTVKLEQIEVDPRAQTRAGELDKDHIEQMVEDLDNLPPMKCVLVGDRLLLADGFHRFAAYRKKRMIRVDVLAASGSEDDWIDAFAKANDDQKGKPRTRADKRCSVARVLGMRPNWSNVRVAESAGVSDEFVRKLRVPGSNVGTSLGAETANPSEKREGKDGKSYPATQPKPMPKPPVYRDPEDVEDPIYDSGETVVFKDRGEEDYDESEPKAQPTLEPEPEPVKQLEPVPEGDTEQSDTKIIGPVMVDEWGIEIQPHAVDAFATLPKFKELLTNLKTCQKLFNELAKSPGGVHLQSATVADCRVSKGPNGEAVSRFVMQALERAIQQVDYAKPSHTVCPWRFVPAPHPQHCTACKGQDWTAQLSKSVSEDIKQTVLAAAAAGRLNNG